MDMGEAAIIVAPQQEALVECDSQSDDLLGEELNKMEVVPSSHQVDQGSTEAVKKTSGKRSTSSKGTSRSRVPHCLPSKKAEFFRRGSPRKRNAISIGLPPSGETDEHGQPRPSSSRKAKASSRHDDDNIGFVDLPTKIRGENQSGRHGHEVTATAMKSNGKSPPESHKL
ncbi:hypothetical protein Bca4012_099139 [Brassica carinata]|uniref:Uncharacterized protein n=1 Tax=Brassica carinata TaxID=52824 RepID=A0A8X7TRB4_BRACI|nr:hypothetical protein Bca52824_081791 [Brassica carinata]